MATLSIYNDGHSRYVLLYRNGVEHVEKKYNGYSGTYMSSDIIQRDGYYRQINECMLHFNDDPEPDRLWIYDWQTSFRDFMKMFGYDMDKDKTNSHNTFIDIENVDPWICFTETHEMVMYFGEDKPVLKGKTSKIFTKHRKMWTGHCCFYNDKQKTEPYYYWDVKDKSKLVICRTMGEWQAFPEVFDKYKEFDNIRVEIKNYLSIEPFKCSDDYEYSQAEIDEIICKEKEAEERRIAYRKEIERRKNTPGYCSCCGSEYATYRIHPYYHEMYNERHWVWMCDDCYNDALGDI